MRDSYPLSSGGKTLEGVKEMREDASEWRIEFDDGTVRYTGLVGIAFYAREFDSEATVEVVE